MVLYNDQILYHAIHFMLPIDCMARSHVLMYFRRTVLDGCLYILHGPFVIIIVMSLNIIIVYVVCVQGKNRSSQWRPVDVVQLYISRREERR